MSIGPLADARHPRAPRSPGAHPATQTWAIIRIEIVAAGRAIPGPRMPDTDLRPAAGEPFRRITRVPTGSGPSEGPTFSDLRIQPRSVPFRANETFALPRKALRVWMRRRIRPTRPTTRRIPSASKARPTAGTDAQARGERVQALPEEALQAARMSSLHPTRS